jgi:DNA primase
VRFNCWRADCGASKSRDTKYHMYINPTKGKYFCQRCQRGGSLEFLAKMLRLPSPERALSLWDKVLHSFLFGEGNAEESANAEISWPPYHKIIPGTTAGRYLADRGISEKRINHYQIGFGSKFLKNRIIFPDTNKDGKLVYWVARTYGKHKAKYKNATAPRQYQVFNLGRIQASGRLGRVVICEGPISAITAGFDAVATRS